MSAVQPLQSDVANKATPWKSRKPRWTLGIPQASPFVANVIGVAGIVLITIILGMKSFG